MSMTVARFLTEEAAHRELPMPPWLYGVIALVAFAFALALTWSFRGTAQKYAPPGHPTSVPPHPEDDEAHWPEHPGHGGHS